MSTTDSKFEQHRDTEGPARRTYASLEQARGFESAGERDDGTGRFVRHVCIKPMDVRTYWRHVGIGKWNSPSAMYEEATP